MSEFISDKLPVDPDLVPRAPVVGTPDGYTRFDVTPPTDGFDRYNRPMIPPRVVITPGIEIREKSITLAVEWLKHDIHTDAARLFSAADLIAVYLRTGEHPADPDPDEE